MSKTSNKYQAAIDSISNSLEFYTVQLDRYARIGKTYANIRGQIIENGVSSIRDSTANMVFLLEVNTHLLISLIDMAIVSKGLLLAEQKWEFTFFSKQAYLAVYESLKRFSASQKRLKEMFLQ